MSTTRQLAAIMFTDIVGYTALMGEDEEKAFAILNKNRAIQKPIIKEYNGQWIKELGDGVLASFQTVSDAITAAIKIQEICNAEKVFQLRIGIHLGEVVFEDGDVFGDGVNIASRIQSIGVPGSIVFSKTVNDEIKNKTKFQIVSLGQYNLKNVKNHIEIFSITDTAFSPFKIKLQGSASKKLLSNNIFIIAFIFILLSIAGFFLFKASQLPYNVSADKKSLAVLPFLNMSEDKQNEYFSDGISLEITNQLSNINSLEVRAWSSSIQFKNSTKSLKEKAEALNASVVLNGSIQKVGDNIRIQAELTDANANKRIWGQTYDRKWADIFTIQSELAQEIASELNTQLTESEKKRIEQSPTNNLQAYELYLQGNQLSEKFLQTLKQDFFDNSKLMFEKAIAIDPNYSMAHAGLARLYHNYAEYIKEDSLLEKLAADEIEKAYSLSPDLDIVYAIRGAMLRDKGDYEESYKNFMRAMQLNPNNTSTLFEFGMLFSNLGLVENRIKLLKKAVRLDPLNATYFAFLGGAEVHINKLNEGLQDLQTGYRLEPGMYYVVDRIAYIYALQNQLKDTKIWLYKFLNELPPERAKQLDFYREYGQYAAYCFAKLGNRTKAMEIAALANNTARVYLALSMKEEALNAYTEEDSAWRPFESAYLYIQSHISHKDFDIIRNDPRFLRLMEKNKKQYELNEKQFKLDELE
jgi:adenylate cyclase